MRSRWFGIYQESVDDPRLDMEDSRYPLFRSPRPLLHSPIPTSPAPPWRGEPTGLRSLIRVLMSRSYAQGLPGRHRASASSRHAVDRHLWGEDILHQRGCEDFSLHMEGEAEEAVGTAASLCGLRPLNGQPRGVEGRADGWCRAGRERTGGCRWKRIGTGGVRRAGRRKGPLNRFKVQC